MSWRRRTGPWESEPVSSSKAAVLYRKTSSAPISTTGKSARRTCCLKISIWKD